MSDSTAADGPTGIFAQFAEQATAERRVQGCEVDLLSIAERAAAEYDEAEEEAAAAAAAAERAAAAEARRKVQERTRIVVTGAEKDKGTGGGLDGPNQGFPLGRLVKVLQPIVMRSLEDVSSAEIGKLTKGQDCYVLARGVDKGGRRLLVKEPDSGMKGWVSCSTKSNKALLELMPGIAVPLEELDPSTTDLAKMPSVEEVLARIDGSGEELAIADQQEAEAEAIAVWRSFTDLAVMEQPQEKEDPGEFDPRCVHARAREQQMESGELLALVAPDQECVERTQDLHLRLLERDRERKASREQQMREKLKDVLAPRARGLMPKMRGICPRNAPQAAAASSAAGPSHGGIPHYSSSIGSLGSKLRARPTSWPEEPDSQLLRRDGCLQSIQELRWQLEEERRQAHQDAPDEPEVLPLEDASVSQAASSSSPARWDDGAEPSGLFPLAVVRVSGLKSAVELNGLRGVCQSQDNTGRWVVRFDTGKCKKFRHENLVLQGENGSCDEPSAGTAKRFGAALESEQPEPQGGMEKFGPAWFGLPEPEDDAVPPPDEGVMEKFGGAWFGQPETGDEDVPPLEDLLKQLDANGREVPEDAQLSQADDACSTNLHQSPKASKPVGGCKDYGQPEYWARLGLAPR